MKEILKSNFILETESRSIELSGIIDPILQKSKRTEDPNESILQHRKLHHELTNGLSKLNKEEFAYGLFCQQIIGNTINDLYEIYQIDSFVAQNIMDTLNNSLSFLSQALKSTGKERSHLLGDWLESFNTFGSFYKDLTFRRDTGDYDYVEANGFTISFSMGKDSLLGIPKEDDYRIFPNLDRNITDTSRSKNLVDGYKNAIKELEAKHGVNSLCFVEKSYSAIGALTLLSQLVSELEMPATIYRMNNWDISTRISGNKPDEESIFCIVYDLAIGGGGILEASNFLHENFGSKVSGAVVFFDYEKKKGAEYNLNKNNIELVSILTMSKVRAEIQSKMEYFRKLKGIRKEFALGKFNAEKARAKTGDVIKEYSTSSK